jgi:lipoprotein-anchoring transpeptidase ErfK/SrfK
LPATLIATLTATVPRYSSPGGPQDGTVPGTWYGAASALPVIGQDGGYLEVRLAQRPDGSTAWISSSSATLTSTPYRIVVDLATERLMLYELGKLAMSAPAGIGTAADPTPTGNFFVAFYAKAPSPAWGPFVIITSGHSRAISDWEQSGDAIMAIHGPLGAGALIGSSGARVSHGCVRLHDAALERLAVVPPGTPVEVVSSLNP